MNSSVETYAQVLFELALEQGNAENSYESLFSFSKALEEVPEYLLFFSSPTLSEITRKKLLLELFPKTEEKWIRNTFLHLCKEGIGKEIPSILFLFFQAFEKEQGWLRMTIITTKPLDSEEKVFVMEQLEKKFHQKILLENEMDSSCISGFILQFDGKQYDLSIKNQFEALRKTLSSLTKK